MPSKKSGTISQRKQARIRKTKKQISEAFEKTLNNITAKLDQGKGLRDQELRFLDKAPERWAELEEGIASETVEALPEGELKKFVERVWKFKDIGEWEEVARTCGYVRCTECGELHLKGRLCMFDEYKDIVSDLKEQEEDKEK